MKKIIFATLFAFVGLSAVAQEGFRVGGYIGLPMGDAADISSFAIGLDAKYMFSVSDQFNVGVATGYQNTITDDVSAFGFSADLPNIQFLPIAASAQFLASEKISLGLDLGYAVGLTDNVDGGFYFRPIVGYNISETFELNLSYSSVSLENTSWSTLNVGVLFSL